MTFECLQDPEHISMQYCSRINAALSTFYQQLPIIAYGHLVVVRLGRIKSLLYLLHQLSYANAVPTRYITKPKEPF